MHAAPILLPNRPPNLPVIKASIAIVRQGRWRWRSRCNGCGGLRWLWRAPRTRMLTTPFLFVVRPPVSPIIEACTAIVWQQRGARCGRRRLSRHHDEDDQHQQCEHPNAGENQAHPIGLPCRHDVMVPSTVTHVLVCELLDIGPGSIPNVRHQPWAKRLATTRRSTPTAGHAASAAPTGIGRTAGIATTSNVAAATADEAATAATTKGAAACIAASHRTAARDSCVDPSLIHCTAIGRGAWQCVRKYT
mmetsp:Transcript_65737/g.165683  ORF Transcript_65737/g.165683 Transcript_65737/m.165683 type:complete len:248 (+) Transcript_65737:994-1737(+)